ncbi:MAG TPA: JAB domain-containing protein [Polyangia bacterium]|nr:JAB domain-containing protein [Polyangia bacterium]
MKKRSSPRDYTSTHTVYALRLRTLTVKLRDSDSPTEDKTLDTFGHPWDMWTVLETVYGTLDDEQEHLVLLILNGAHDLRGYKVMSSGRRDSVTVERRAVIRAAILLGATGIILAHNHPTGPASPSESDLLITRELVWACTAADLEMVDHLIWTRDRGMCSIRRERPDLFEPPKLT